MFLTEDTGLKGCIRIIPKIFRDNRGISVKTFHADTFRDLCIPAEFAEDLIVTSGKNVLRGLHFQNPPYGQSKLVYCIRGRILDVVADIRKGSPTYGEYKLFELSDSNNWMLFIPEGFAHGYLTLEDQSIVMYKMSAAYNPACEDGIRWDSMGIPWGIDKPIVSERDRNFLPFDKFESRFEYVF